jgi:hypothetical protein
MAGGEEGSSRGVIRRASDMALQGVVGFVERSEMKAMEESTWDQGASAAAGRTSRINVPLVDRKAVN